MQVQGHRLSEACAHFEKKDVVGAREGVFPGPHRNGSKDMVQGGQTLTRGPSTRKAFCRGMGKAADSLDEAQSHTSKDKHLMASVTPPRLLSLSRRLDKVRRVVGAG